MTMFIKEEQCDMCQRLLRGFNVAASFYKEIQFIKIDCDIHHDFCQLQNINQYPSFILYSSLDEKIQLDYNQKGLSYDTFNQLFDTYIYQMKDKDDDDDQYRQNSAPQALQEEISPPQTSQEELIDFSSSSSEF